MAQKHNCISFNKNILKAGIPRCGTRWANHLESRLTMLRTNHSHDTWKNALIAELLWRTDDLELPCLHILVYPLIRVTFTESSRGRRAKSSLDEPLHSNDLWRAKSRAVGCRLYMTSWLFMYKSKALFRNGIERHLQGISSAHKNSEMWSIKTCLNLSKTLKLTFPLLKARI